MLLSCIPEHGEHAGRTCPVGRQAVPAVHVLHTVLLLQVGHHPLEVLWLGLQQQEQQGQD